MRSLNSFEKMGVFHAVRINMWVSICQANIAFPNVQLNKTIKLWNISKLPMPTVNDSALVPIKCCPVKNNFHMVENTCSYHHWRGLKYVVIQKTVHFVFHITKFLIATTKKIHYPYVPRE